MVEFAVPPSIIALLQDETFPCTAAEMIRFAEKRGVPEEFIGQLRAMPNHIFKSIDDLALSWGFAHKFRLMEEAAPAPAPPADADRLAPTKAGGESTKGESSAP